jgi:hypothetical protein
MALQSIGVAPIAPTEFLTPEQDELNKNAFIHRELAEAVRHGRSYEDGLAGLIAQALEAGPVTGEPRWRRRWTTGTGRVVEFKSFAAFVESADGLATNPTHLLQLLEISKNPEVARLSDQVRQSLKLPVGSNQFIEEGPNNVRSLSAELVRQEAGNSAAGVRRKIRNWLRSNADHPNHNLAQQWLAKLEANPKSRLHQQALREIGIGGERKKLLDVSGVSDALLDRLHSLARDEGIAVAELIEDALAVYFRMEEQGWPATEEPEAQASSPEEQSAPAKTKTNGHSATATGIIELPAPGFYKAAEIARLMGKKPTSFCSYVSKADDGRELCQRDLIDSPIRIVVRKDRPPEERCEVISR